ncbi:MAG: ribonuclease E/G [Phenylobacterium sp.]
MSERRLFLDVCAGEQRAVVLLDGRPERLLIRRDGEAGDLLLGARHRARVRRVEPALGSAFLELGGGAEAMMDFRPDARPVQGQALEVEIRSEPRAGKLALVRPLGEAAGPPALLAPPPDLAEQLQALVPSAFVETGREARAAADEAEAEALETVFALEGGGSLAIEPTRALTAVDVDVGARQGHGAKQVARQANLTALREAARLLRLKGLGGLVVVDLAGRGHDGTALLGAARAAFAPDNPGVAMGPIGKFGTLELVIPRRARPVVEQLCGADGRPTARTLAQRLVRMAEREAAADPGAQFELGCGEAVGREAGPLVAALTARIGARASLAVDPGAPGDRLDVRRR